MACALTIPFWPSSPDCLSWSADNQIAVTGGEEIAILTPRLREKGPGGRLWDTTVLKVNAFTSKEIPLVDPPLSNANFSLGEDLSLRQALEAKWSPPGLAIHKGCALAVLTANHVLSIWAPSGRSDVADNWSRLFVVNHVVAEYYESTATSQQNGTSLGEEQVREQNRVHQRIRSFAWSPSLMRTGEDYGHHEYYLAVSTEGGDVLFLRVKSPHSGLSSKDAEWNLAIVGVLPLSQTTRRHVNAAEWMCWNDWETEDDANRTCQFAYIHGGKLYTALVKRQSNAFAVESRRLQVRARDDVCGPIRFVPGDDRGSLIAFGEDTVFQIDTKADAATPRTHHLDGRWDEVSGLAFTNTDDGVLLHITSLLSMSNASTTTLTLPLQEDGESAPPAWQHAISESKAVYDADLDLGGHVLERTSGIASSPLGDYVATLTTMHSSDSIAYVINIDQISRLNISLEYNPSEENLLPPRSATYSTQGLSAEAVLFSLVRQVERNTESEESENIDHDTLLREAARCRPFSKDTASAIDPITAPPPDGSPEGLFHYLKRVLCADNQVLAAQASRIADIALTLGKPRPEVTRQVAQRLVQEILKLPDNDSSVDNLSESIKKVFTVVTAKLNPTKKSTANGTPDSSLETCKICRKPIPFESLRWSKCSSGHQFSRCALSFLSIQEPGTTKSCGTCTLQYLNEKKFPDVEPATDDDIEMADVPSAEGNIGAPANDTWVEVSRNPNASPRPTRTLAQILFAACDVCIYCGGKFVD